MNFEKGEKREKLRKAMNHLALAETLIHEIGDEYLSDCVSMAINYECIVQEKHLYQTLEEALRGFYQFKAKSKHRRVMHMATKAKRYTIHDRSQETHCNWCGIALYCNNTAYRIPDGEVYCSKSCLELHWLREARLAKELVL